MADQLLTLTVILLVLAVLANLGRMWQPHYIWDRISLGLLSLSSAVIIGMIIPRITETHRLPVANMYEFSMLFALIILAGYLFMRKYLNSPLFDLPVALLLLLLLTIVGTLPSDLKPLMPALQSRWLHVHVATAILAYAAFALAFCLGVMYLTAADLTDADLKSIDRRIYKLVVFGFTLLTIVIITGAVWAEEVWGNWWSWDPKETWSLVTWVVYAAYLHARRTSEWKGRKSAWLVVIGFIVVLFTLFGVSVLLPGLHSYA